MIATKKWKNVTSMKKFISFSKPRLGTPPTKYHFPRRSRYLRRFSIARGADHGVFGGKAHTLKQKKQQNPVVTSIVFFVLIN